jgi:hypothetical protein
MTEVDVVVRQAEFAGVLFELEGGRVKVRFPESRRGELTSILFALRERKREVVEVLRRRAAPCTVTVEVLGRPFKYQVESREHPNPSLITILVNGCEHIVHRSLEGAPFAAKEHAVICENQGFRK